VKGLKTTLTMAIAIGLLAGSTVGVAAVDEPEATGEQAASSSSEFNEYERYTILDGDLWFCQGAKRREAKNKKTAQKNEIVWDADQVRRYKKKQCTRTTLDTSAHIDIEATNAVFHQGESLSDALESGDVNLLDSNPLLSSATADIFAPCRTVAQILDFVDHIVGQDAADGTTGTDESQWSAHFSDPEFAAFVEENLATCKEAIDVVSPASTSSAE
jgi:hypothetical protein